LSTPILQVKNLSKSFSGIKVLDNVSLTLNKGEVHALMGENGAGKSTFMKILIGLLKPEAGEVILEGENLTNKTIQNILAKGIAMIHQEILMVPELTVAQNIFLGKEIHNYNWLNNKLITQKTNAILSGIGLNLDVNTKVKNLSIAQMQQVEIAKAISNNAKVIIMDEPTSALSEAEVNALFNIIDDLKSKNIAIIYISHKLHEIFKIADQITVLRDGKHISTKNKNETNQKELISMMVGREIADLFPKNEQNFGKLILSVKNLGVKDVFSNISFEVKAGEVLGIAGLVGAGRTEIARAIAGFDKLNTGEIYIEDKKSSFKSPKQAAKEGIAYVSEDRKTYGFIPQLSVKENISLSSINKLGSNWLIKNKKESILTSEMCEKLKIDLNKVNQKVIYLSGGNQQKVVLAKVLACQPKLLILDEPTRGIDIGAKVEIYQLINELKKNGLAIILISSEMPEIMGLSDRIMVIAKGKQQIILNKNEATQELILQHSLN
jgi:inositol transport system ATP-binding protein